MIGPAKVQYTLAPLRDTNRPDITKVIALKDIQFSNSPIEAVNKIYKQYLRQYQPKSRHALEQVTQLFVHDYGSLRPHGSLKGLIPMEAFITPALTLDFRQAIREARAIRIEENQQVNCSLCPPACPDDAKSRREGRIPDNLVMIFYDFALRQAESDESARKAIELWGPEVLVARTPVMDRPSSIVQNCHFEITKGSFRVSRGSS